MKHWRAVLADWYRIAHARSSVTGLSKARRIDNKLSDAVLSSNFVCSNFSPLPEEDVVDDNDDVHLAAIFDPWSTRWHTHFQSTYLLAQNGNQSPRCKHKTSTTTASDGWFNLHGVWSSSHAICTRRGLDNDCSRIGHRQPTSLFTYGLILRAHLLTPSNVSISRCLQNHLSAENDVRNNRGIGVC